MASTSKYPERFGSSGRELWGEIDSKFSLNVPEKLVLKQACRAADRLDEIQAEMNGQALVVQGKVQPVANPLMVEFRLQAQLLTKLIASLRIPDVAPEQPVSRPQRRGGARGTYATNPAALAVVRDAQ
ncbi:hypothetical protein P3H15_22800 [Rhodococcus sp. T2V]|uniref:hypothetical protein n=1 Tax=Rhodococcus sp. T2V TaxID=3034164 RepID=UPI0023E2404E|nr:hypothetical protein [Rhodococcus sp. T2V]MDF3307856.1 hypothetical protein [Rhodococcus sp. T2V]